MGDRRPFRFTGVAAPAPPAVRIVSAIDVSSYQPRDLAPLIKQLQPEHVVVRMYLPFENPPQAHSRAQVESARANGCSVGTYLWLYRNADPVATARDAIALARSCGVEPPVMWVDLEVYPPDGTVPTITTALACLLAIAAEGVRPGVYTSKHMIDQYFGSTTAFCDYLLWTAQYDGVAALDVAPYCGWPVERIVGKQWQGSPIDRSMFFSSVC